MLEPQRRAGRNKESEKMGIDERALSLKNMIYAILFISIGPVVIYLSLLVHLVI